MPIALPPPATSGRVSVEEALALRRSVREYRDEPLPLAAAAQLLWAAQGRSHPEGLRTAPSAGATYPLELYLVAGAVEGLDPAIYRYRPANHSLDVVRRGDHRTALAAAALEQECVANAPGVLAVAAVVSRTASRYGGRAERYVLLEVGHAVENAALQAVALGLGSVVVGAFDDLAVARLLGLPPGASPWCLLPVGLPRAAAG